MNFSTQKSDWAVTTKCPIVNSTNIRHFHSQNEEQKSLCMYLCMYLCVWKCFKLIFIIKPHTGMPRVIFVCIFNYSLFYITIMLTDFVFFRRLYAMNQCTEYYLKQTFVLKKTNKHSWELILKFSFDLLNMTCLLTSLIYKL